MSGFDYGNARLRAMWSRLFDRRSYQELISTGSLDGLLGGLAHTTYEQYVSASVARLSSAVSLTCKLMGMLRSVA